MRSNRAGFILLVLLVSALLFGCLGHRVLAPRSLLSADSFLTTAQIDTLERYVAEFPNHSQLAIAFLKDDTTHFIGISRLDDTLRFIDNKDSVFEIGSISKVFTATLLAQLVVEGKLHLDDSLSHFFPFKLHNYPKNGREITLRTLANHTSGLPELPSGFIFHAIIHFHLTDPYRDYDEPWLNGYLANRLALDFAPAEKYQYSTLGIGILGHILAQSAGLSYEELLRTRIFEPHQMTSSSTRLSNVRAKVVNGRYANGGLAPNWHLNVFAGAGGIKSSTGDLAKFIRAQLDDGNSAFALIRDTTFQIDERNYVALGWHAVRTRSGDLWFVHGSGTRGYTASIKMDPKKRRAIIVLSNLSNLDDVSINIENVCIQLMKTL